MRVSAEHPGVSPLVDSHCPARDNRLADALCAALSWRDDSCTTFADITIFDLGTVSAALDGNKRYPKGIEYVVVNGQVVVDASGYHGAMAGRVVRRGDAERDRGRGSRNGTGGRA